MVFSQTPPKIPLNSQRDSWFTFHFPIASHMLAIAARGTHRMGPQDSVQLPYKWLISMVYGRYNELVHGGYNGL